MAQQFRFRELSQTFIIRNLSYPLLSIRNDTVYLCLLTHYLRNMNSIGILGRPPRKFPPMQCIPSENFPLQCCDLIRLHSVSQNKKDPKIWLIVVFWFPFSKEKRALEEIALHYWLFFLTFVGAQKKALQKFSLKSVPRKCTTSFYDLSSFSWNSI